METRCKKAASWGMRYLSQVWSAPWRHSKFNWASVNRRGRNGYRCAHAGAKRRYSRQMSFEGAMRSSEAVWTMLAYNEASREYRLPSIKHSQRPFADMAFLVHSITGPVIARNASVTNPAIDNRITKFPFTRFAALSRRCALLGEHRRGRSEEHAGVRRCRSARAEDCAVHPELAVRRMLLSDSLQLLVEQSPGLPGVISVGFKHSLLLSIQFVWSTKTSTFSSRTGVAARNRNSRSLQLLNRRQAVADEYRRMAHRN